MTDVDVERSFREAARYWWIFLVIGAGWLVFAMIVFRFDWRSVSAISILFGIVVIAAAIEELFAVFAGERSGWARFGHALLALAFFVIGIVAFVHPGNTFSALAGVMSFYFVLKGMLDVGLAVSVQLPHREVRWPALVPGAVLFGIGLLLVNVFNVYVTTRLVEGRADTYGALGIATALLLSLVIVGRLIVVSAELNALLARPERSA